MSVQGQRRSNAQNGGSAIEARLSIELMFRCQRFDTFYQSKVRRRPDRGIGGVLIRKVVGVKKRVQTIHGSKRSAGRNSSPNRPVRVIGPAIISIGRNRNAGGLALAESVTGLMNTSVVQLMNDMAATPLRQSIAQRLMFYCTMAHFQERPAYMDSEDRWTDLTKVVVQIWLPADGTNKPVFGRLRERIAFMKLWRGIAAAPRPPAATPRLSGQAAIRTSLRVLTSPRPMAIEIGRADCQRGAGT
jgi:hypothetical protein